MSKSREKLIKAKIIKKASYCQSRKSIIYLANYSLKFQIYETKQGQEKRLSQSQNNISDYYLDQQGEKVYYLADQLGDENYHIYELDLKTKVEKQVSQQDQYKRQIVGKVKDQFYYIANYGDKAKFKLYVKEKDETKLVSTCGGEEFTISPDQKYLSLRKIENQAQSKLYLINLDEQSKRRIDHKKSSPQSVTWYQDSQSFLYLSDQDSDYPYIYHYDLASHSSKLVKKEEQIEKIQLSPDCQYLAILKNIQGYSHLIIENLARRERLKIADQVYISSLDWSQDSRKILYVAESPSELANIWEYDLDRQKTDRLSQNKIDGLKLIEPVQEKYQSFDQIELDYWHYQPRQRLASLIYLHGGPASQVRAAFNQRLQILAQAGIEVFAPNIRGSSGYGKEFTALDDREKRLDTIKDVKSLLDHLIEQKRIEKGKTIVFGASYGGYMCISCLARLNEYWSCGITLFGIYNLESMLERTSDYRRKHREFEYGYLDRDRKLLYQLSPIAVIENIKARLMIVHGKNDPRVPLYEAEKLRSDLQKLGKKPEYLIYPDEGHGLKKIENQLDFYGEMMRFIHEVHNES